jgi:DNA repair protein RecO (recombination protein O)
MVTTRVVLESAFVLHSRPYRDTSLLIEVLTENYGRLSILAQGVRSLRSRKNGLLVPFLPLLLSFSGKTNLQTLRHVEASGLSYNLVGKDLISGFYLNELLVKLLPQHIPYPNIFQIYNYTLAELVNSENLELTLRIFEKCLLMHLGYGLQLDRTVDNEEVLAEENYIFEFGVGLKIAKYLDNYTFSGRSLLALQAGVLITQKEFRDAKRLLRSVLFILLDKKPLKSRELFGR